jgi:peptidyl-prolyl cis-trans isomerase B (cyclophilin B)
MKRVFPRQSTAFALMLALSVSMGAPNASQAALKDAWNPIHWFPGHSDGDAAELARQKAETAQKEADLALQEAQHAKERADKARQAADALKSHPAKHPTKMVVTKPSPEDTDSTATAPSSTSDAQTAPDSSATAATSESTATDDAQAESKSSVNAAATEQTENTAPKEVTRKEIGTQETAKGASWNPTHWFKDSDTKATRETRPEKSVDEAQESTQTSRPAEKSKASAAWNPMSWLGSNPIKAKNNRTAPAAATDSDAATPEPDNAKGSDTASQNDAIAKTKVALIETEKGNIAFELYPDQAPLTVANFVKLVDNGFYNKFNMRFHRVIPGFVLQTGDPTGTGAGGSKETIPLEAKNKLSHNGKGVVAMARGADPNSASSQFYITLAPQASLDGKYAIFGRVISGLDVLDKIEKGDMLYGIRLVDSNSVVRDPQPDKKKFFSSLF